MLCELINLSNIYKAGKFARLKKNTKNSLTLVKIKEYRKSAKNSEEVGRRRRKKKYI